MPWHRWWDNASVCPGAPLIRALRVDADEWSRATLDAAAASARLLALWGAEARADVYEVVVRAALLTEAGVLILELPVGTETARYPGLETVFPCASRMQRALYDLLGVRASDPDTRPWLRHAVWPAGMWPLRAHGPQPLEAQQAGTMRSIPVDDYPFIRVEGEGVHEIPVGPVHAGIIEPGHFRFSVVGEKVLRLEERFGYVHKGIERRFTTLPVLEGHRLAARVSGDAAVAFTWAYCQALEGISGCTPPPRAVWLRALFLELERMANHLGDLGALGNDAGFAFGLAQFSRLKEDILRTTETAFGQRYLFDAVVPGGTAVDLSADGAAALAGCVERIVREVDELREIYDEHAGVRDRFTGTGTLTPELALRLGVLGLAGRASGQALDLRIDLPCAPYETLGLAKVVCRDGDVAARVAVRFDEIAQSGRLMSRLMSELPSGTHRIEVPMPVAGRWGAGMVEGWRGPVFVSLEAGPGGSIRHCHPHDPSWQNWPALEHAIIGNIVPDFPLINKSFNLSYSGHDL